MCAAKSVHTEFDSIRNLPVPDTIVCVKIVQNCPKSYNYASPFGSYELGDDRT